MNKYTVGTLAYFDSMTGLIPCKVTNVEKWEDKDTHSKETRITAIVTANRPAYPKGIVLDFFRAAGRFIPRESVYRSRQHCGQLRIRNYEWIEKK